MHDTQRRAVALRVCVQVTYDTLGRLTEWRQSLSSDVSHDDVVSYVYDVDNNVISVNGSRVTCSDWQDAAGSGEVDGDGLVVERRRQAQRLVWSSRSELRRVTAPHSDSTYIYDALGRLTAVRRRRRRPLSTSLQLFYADTDEPQRLTHVHDTASGTTVEYLYDGWGGQLCAARLNGSVMLYVAVDPHHSPVVVFTESGQVVRRMSYTPVGSVRTHQVRSVPWHIGYRGAFLDDHAQLLFFAGGRRVMDPLSGRWLSPNYQPFTDRRRHSLSSFIRHSDLYETNFLCHSEVTPPPMMLSKSQLTRTI